VAVDDTQAGTCLVVLHALEARKTLDGDKVLAAALYRHDATSGYRKLDDLKAEMSGPCRSGMARDPVAGLAYCPS
jgi:hypothetical protein